MYNSMSTNQQEIAGREHRCPTKPGSGTSPSILLKYDKSITPQGGG